MSGNLTLELSTSGAAVGFATLCTNPIDVVKTRLQLVAGQQRAPGLLQTAVSVATNEGVMGFTKGVAPAVARGLTYGGMRIGLYTPLKNAMPDMPGSSSTLKKFVAGTLSGSIAGTMCNPLELVKTQLQQHNTQFRTPAEVVRNIVQQNGIMGLWKGAIPGVARTGLLTASQCATYDVVKSAVMQHTQSEGGLATHVVSGAITGLVTTTVTCPADVLKTRMFSEAGAGQQRGVVETAVGMLRNEGAGAFFKGWVANYVRLGPQTLLTFVVVEQLRSLAGMGSF